MKKVFEEPDVNTVQIISEVITNDVNGDGSPAGGDQGVEKMSFDPIWD